ncbi:MAG: NAD(P)H-dependent oxidoreductase [Bacteroidetes bacterium]|nr:NAD(P)H-dependent oxidoreductase [Bacteroidota bacterium]
MKKILIINGHPNQDSFNFAIAKKYKEGANEAGAEIREIVIKDLEFSLSLKYGYQMRTELEPCLVEAQQQILWADHLVWIHPVWWGGLPAIMKGFIDRVFLPGFAFKYRENSVWWDKLLSGKTATIITTLDQPGWYYRLAYGRPSINQLKKSTLEFCGIKPVKVFTIGPIRNSTLDARNKWLTEVAGIGTKEANSHSSF